MRLLIALAAVESPVANYAESLAHLEAARGMADDLDDRRRAMFLFNLAISYRETGDVEAAIRTGTQGLALLRAAGSSFDRRRSRTTWPWPTSLPATSPAPGSWPVRAPRVRGRR